MERWIELSKTAKSYEGLKYLILREQFILCCSKERITPSNLKDMAKYADQFAEAKSTKSSSLNQTYVGLEKKKKNRQLHLKEKDRFRSRMQNERVTRVGSMDKKPSILSRKVQN